MMAEADLQQVSAGQDAFVRPLRYMGRRAGARPNLSVETGRDKPLKVIAGTGQVPTAITVLTPPLTPQISFDGSPRQSDGQQPVSFYNYLRVFCHFHPSEPVLSDSQESSVTIPINQGDIVLVHSVQPNGWADGTLLNSGARGWLPTNYCRGYDHDHARILLNALTYVWEFIRGHEDDERSIFARQDYVRCMIAGVRVLLERSGCLTRDAEPVKLNPNLRRLRKGLLGDLSAFAKGAKSVQDACQEANLADEEFFPLLDAVVLKAFKVVIRAIRFLDTWILHVSAAGRAHGAEIGGGPLGAAPVSAPHLPSPTNTLLSPDSRVATPNTATLVHPATPATAVTPFAEALWGPGSPADCAARAPQGLVASPDQLGPPSPHLQAEPCHASTAAADPSPAAITVTEPQQSPGFSTSPSTTASSSSAAVKRASASHRLSHNAPRRPTPGSNNDLASDRLHLTHDAFLSNLGAFIGLHLQSRPSMELLVTTQQSVVACQALLNVVEAIYQRDFRRSGAVDESRLLMHAHLAELVHATKDILEATEAAHDEDVCLPEQGKRLMDAATMCVRSAGDCVAKSRSVIERIGDFEFDFHGLAYMEASTHAGQDQEAQQLTPREACFEMDTGHRLSQNLRAPSPAPHSYNKRSSSLPPPREPLLPPPPPPTQPTSPRGHHTTSSNTWKKLPLPPPPHQQDATEPAVDAAPAQSKPALPMTSANFLTLDVDIPQTSFIDMDDTPSTPIPENRRSERADSQGESIVASTYSSSMRHSGGSTRPSTRATTPDHYADREAAADSLKASMDSLPEDMGAQADEAEAEVFAENHAHELVHNKDGLIIGGSMPALVERLTTHDSTPDALFVTSFYLTFRLFTTPVELAQALIERFDRTRDDSEFATPVRLRVYNVFKGWLEAYWQADTDAAALKLIVRFATTRLQNTLPSAARRLIELSTQCSEPSQGQSVSKLVSSMGRPRAVSNATPSDTAAPPPPMVSKSQMNMLRNFKASGAQCTILDLDPMELARQFTLLQMKVFCAIQPDELLALEWTKKDSNKASNVRAMSALSTDLANLVADTILQLEAKKRATLIKQWVKIADKCYELGNYDALMAIICSLNSSMVLRLKKTWDLVSAKTLGKLDFLKTVVDCSRNYAVLRQRLQSHVAPCLPFVGIYLTDLTFIDAGNPDMRQLPGASGSGDVNVINFDKHMKTTKIITDLQRFQVPYKLQALPEMQEWMEVQISRVRNAEQSNVQNYYRRSLLLEPREGPPPSTSMPTGAGASSSFPPPSRGSPPGSSAGPLSKAGAAQPGARERFEFWSAKHFPMNKEKVQS